jgi:single-stranded-DNA-specific exonuclease
MLGIDLIITDHHEPLSRLPNAYAVINPKCSHAYPYRDICGCAVAYKLACVLIDRLVPDNDRRRRKLYLLPLVTLATVADIVPLHGENRALVAQGLSLMRQSDNLPP